MKKSKTIKTENAAELARALRLSPSDAVELSVRRELNEKIIQAAQASGLSHAELAKAVRMSRTRLTAILNRNRSHVSTDLMLRILTHLGYRPKITFVRTRSAA